MPRRGAIKGISDFLSIRCTTVSKAIKDVESEN